MRLGEINRERGRVRGHLKPVPPSDFDHQNSCFPQPAMQRKEKERQRNREAEIERRAPPRSSAITVRAPSISPIRIFSFRFLFNFLNIDACDPEIEKEEKINLAIQR